MILIVFLFKPDYIRSFFGDRGTEERRSRAEEILKERYARGEIDEEEYMRRLNNLKGGE